MKCNVGLVDRVLRITFGLAIAVLGIVFNSWWGLIGIIPLATGIFKICPLYIPFKLSTTKKEK
ncbi:MAG: DUF2892 domain-containing protein [Prolixibacteraceae bacterium]|jgi:hypothetical protein|nr:DUF2892 domain-containing protein [Prolixibacteraceae bacterium]MBT6005868.1 DUF2892 domain-containing protein [Prolixibacteraceae bacterium]MBT6763864.1 DUF2892 domain-containing protein [Prolixibacteraceae bacterium]MBT6997096.1 DUF2892 domain-containing protein [Prolixibacteraceae bacterium]MBT7393371.1 DUF2892 domain-containing protein [Prolixibacteraceae bacterium]